MIRRLTIPGSTLEGKTHGELIRPVRGIMEPDPHHSLRLYVVSWVLIPAFV